MSWGLGWKRPTEVFHLSLSYGSDADTLDDPNATSSGSSSASSSVSASSPPPSFQDAATNNPEQLGFRIDLDWNAGDDEDQVALKLQSQVMIALPTQQDTVEIEFTEKSDIRDENLRNVEDEGEGDLENNGGDGNLANNLGDGNLENNLGDGNLENNPIRS